MFIPVLKDMLNELLKDINFIQLDIKETFDKKKNEFTYEISLAENPLFQDITNLYKFRYYITLNNNNKNKNNAHQYFNQRFKRVIFILKFLYCVYIFAD